jgi:mRNA interferase MazF
VRRGEVWWVSLPSPRGSEPGFRRPVVVIQSDEFTRSRIRKVIAAVLTSNLRLAEAPGNVLVPAKEAGLHKDSVVNASQIVTLDKSFLMEKAGRLSAARMRAVEDGVRLVLSL